MDTDRCPSCGRPRTLRSAVTPETPEVARDDYLQRLPETLYRLKSNTTTIVKYEDGYTTVVWCPDMFSGYDARWMMAHPRNKANLIPLTPAERAEVVENLRRFLGVKRQTEKRNSRR